MSETDTATSGDAKPSNFLILAIASRIVGFFPLGVVSTVYASRVDGLWLDGRWAEALATSRRARSWAIASLITAAAIFVLVMMLGLTLLLLIVFTPRFGDHPWQNGSQ